MLHGVFAQDWRTMNEDERNSFLSQNHESMGPQLLQQMHQTFLLVNVRSHGQIQPVPNPCAQLLL